MVFCAVALAELANARRQPCAAKKKPRALEGRGAEELHRKRVVADCQSAAAQLRQTI